jgi:hypothetical protein
MRGEHAMYRNEEMRSAASKKAAETRAARKATTERRAAQFAEASRIVATGRCPECGQALRRNLALTGWWQCVGYGAEGFRAAGSKECLFQTFTEH